MREPETSNVIGWYTLKGKKRGCNENLQRLKD